MTPTTAGGHAAEDRSVDDLAPPERTDAWQRMLSDLIIPMSVQARLPSAFTGRLRRQWVDDLALVDCRTDAFSGRRRRASSDPGNGDFVSVVMSVAGYEDVRDCRVANRLQPGAGALLGEDADFEFDIPGPYRKQILLVPTQALRDSGVGALGDRTLVLSPESASVALLGRYLESLALMLPAMAPAGVTAARNAALHLVVGAIEEAEGRNHSYTSSVLCAPALRTAMDRWIDEHVGDEDLSPEGVAAAHAVSTRTVHRLFASAGETFGEAVRTRRLAGARGELLGTDLSVTLVASRWGFADASHFSRLFRRAYGQTPSEYRRDHWPR